MNYKEFVEYIYKRISADKGIRAILRRADNPSFEWRSWGLLHDAGIDIINEHTRRAYVIIVSAIAKSKTDHNGAVSLGQAFRKISSDARSSEFSLRFRRLLSADSMDELLDILRPALSHILSEGIQLDFAELLNDLISLKFNKYRIKLKWANEYLNFEQEDADGSF